MSNSSVIQKISMISASFYLLILYLIIGSALSVPMMPDQHPELRQDRPVNNGNNRFSFDLLPLNCKQNIISKIGDPYDIANFMATCSRTRDIIESIDDPTVVRRPDPEEYVRRNQPVRITPNFANLYLTQQGQLTTKDLILSSAWGNPLFGISTVIYLPVPLIFAQLIQVQTNNQKLMVFGADIGKSFLMYSAMRRFQGVPWVASEPVLVADNLRDPNPGGVSGFIFNNYFAVSSLPFDKWSKEDYLDITGVFMALYDVLRNLRHLDSINVRYQRNIIDHQIILIGNNFDNHPYASHIFLDPAYTKAFDPYLPNENVMLVVASFSKYLNGYLDPMLLALLVDPIVEFFCKFKMARSNVRLMSTFGEYDYRCYDIYQEYSDTVSYDDVHDELESIRSLLSGSLFSNT